MLREPDRLPRGGVVSFVGQMLIVPAIELSRQASHGCALGALAGDKALSRLQRARVKSDERTGLFALLKEAAVVEAMPGPIAHKRNIRQVTGPN